MGGGRVLAVAAASVMMMLVGCGSLCEAVSGGLHGRRGMQQCSNGGFTASCRDFRLSGTTLSATCGNGAGGSVRSSLNLNEHAVNRNGDLACESGGGGFAASCANILLVPTRSGEDLYAECRTTSGSSHITTVDLNSCVVNRSGYLRWSCGK